MKLLNYLETVDLYNRWTVALQVVSTTVLFLFIYLFICLFIIMIIIIIQFRKPAYSNILTIVPPKHESFQIKKKSDIFQNKRLELKYSENFPYDTSLYCPWFYYIIWGIDRCILKGLVYNTTEDIISIIKASAPQWQFAD